MKSRLIATALAALVAMAAPLQEVASAATIVFRPPIASKNKLKIGGDTALPGAPGPNTPTPAPTGGAEGTPIMANIPNQAFKVGDSVDITPSVIDKATGAPFDTTGYSFKHTMTIPAGLAFDYRNGSIRGTAAAPALVRFITIQGTKTGMPTISRYYELRIEPAQALAVSDAAALSSIVRQSSSTSVAGGPTILNKYGSVTFTRTGGLSVSVNSTNGNLTYSATTAKLPLGVHTVNIRVTDAMGRILDYVHTVDVRAIDLTVAAVVAVNPGKPYSGAAIPVYGAVGSKTFSYTGLPSGLSYDTSTGAISGTVPMSLANTDHPATVTVTDSSGGTATRNFTLRVNKGGHRFWRFRPTNVAQVAGWRELKLSELTFYDDSGVILQPTAIAPNGQGSGSTAALFDGNSTALGYGLTVSSPSYTMTQFGNAAKITVDFGTDVMVAGVAIDIWKQKQLSGDWKNWPPLSWAVEWSDVSYSAPYSVQFTGSNSQANWNLDTHYLSLAP